MEAKDQNQADNSNQNQALLTQEHLDQMFASSSGHVNIGPITINWNASLVPPQVVVSASLLGVSIGSITLNPQHPTLTLGGSVGPFTAKITFTVDFKARTISYDIVLKTPFGGKEYKGTIHF